MPAIRRYAAFTVLCLAGMTTTVFAQQQDSGTFVLHKFAKAIGSEKYSIVESGDEYTLTSHFAFTDRGETVPLEATFKARRRDMLPRSYVAKGRSSRLAEMDDSLTVEGDAVSVMRGGKTESIRPGTPWFITDGYSPVAMQEQMMRWWLSHGQPTAFTVLPFNAAVHIKPAGMLQVGGRNAQGYTVGGLIWGQESLWMDDSGNLLALVSTDAEFDHFEAVREPYADSLKLFIAAAVRSELTALASLTANARMAPAPILAIVGATLEDSTGAAPIPDSVILIRQGLISAVGSRASVKIPSDAVIVNASGKFAIPGLWDMHAHYEQVEWGPIYLAAGITSVRDVGNEFDFIRTLHEELDRPVGPAIGPHLEFAGVIDGKSSLSIGAIVAETPSEAEAWVNKYKTAGARQIKIYSSVKPEIVRAITARAHALGMTTTGHIPQGMTAIEGVHDGMDQINHLQYEVPYFSRPVLDAEGQPDRTKPIVLDVNGARGRDLISTLKEHHTVLDPTMALFELLNSTEAVGAKEPGIDHVAPQLRAALDSPPATEERRPLVKARWDALMATLRALHQAGIPMVAGTDQAIPGYSLHRELELYVEAGFTPLEALQTATLEAARAAGVESESGSLQVGKRGDVLLLDADPLVDIHATRAVWRTVAAGSVYEPAPLWESVGFKP